MLRVAFAAPLLAASAIESDKTRKIFVSFRAYHQLGK
jgi:hypothetical protein